MCIHGGRLADCEQALKLCDRRPVWIWSAEREPSTMTERTPLCLGLFPVDLLWPPLVHSVVGRHDEADGIAAGRVAGGQFEE